MKKIIICPLYCFVRLVGKLNIVASTEFNSFFCLLRILHLFVFKRRTVFYFIIIVIGTVIGLYCAAFLLGSACFKEPFAAQTKNVAAVPHIKCGIVYSVKNGIFFYILKNDLFHYFFLLRAVHILYQYL